jgi:hypothetical protein
MTHSYWTASTVGSGVFYVVHSKAISLDRLSSFQLFLSLFVKGGTAKEGENNKSLHIEQIYGHGSQRGSMPGVTVLAGCRQ